MQQIKLAIDKISSLRAELNDIFQEDEGFKTRCNSVLVSLENGLRHTVGLGSAVEGEGFIPSPIVIKSQQNTAITEDNIKPSLADLEALKKEAEDAYSTFTVRDNSDIIKSLDDIVIRAVAKKAGLDVTSTIPEKVDEPFVQSIKNAIIQSQSVEAAKEAIKDEDTERQATEAKPTTNPVKKISKK